MLIPVKDMKYDATSEKILQILQNKTQSTITEFFRVSIAFHLTRMASMMRTKVHTRDRGEIPVNGYMINLAMSGAGKGISTNLIEEKLTSGFRDKFTDVTFPDVAKINLAKIALHRYNLNTDPDATQENELARVNADFDDLGELPFDYDSATVPAFKQVRHKALMAEIGSLNLMVDECGSNLLANTDILTAYLECYDRGFIKQKVTKNTSDNKRLKEIKGAVPSNMLLFGTPSKLLDGAKTEDEFMSMLETGYARRCIFGFSNNRISPSTATPEEIYNIASSITDTKEIDALRSMFSKLADASNFNQTITVDKAVSLLVIEYRTRCEKEAYELPEHQHLQQTELMHRFFKVLKLAGAYAFIESSASLKESHLYAAIKLVEDSGESFTRILARDKSFVKLARFIGSSSEDLTKSDLAEELPCYRGSEPAKREMISLAIAYGYKNNIIIKEKSIDGIDFYSGEMLEETDLDKMIVSYSGDIVRNYKNKIVTFSDLSKLTNAPNLHFTNHHLLPKDK